MSPPEQDAPPERDPETLALFLEESLEALTRMEQLLLDAERGTRSPDLLATLFRDLHTIKGTSGFLSLFKIVALSHAAEDFLAKVRDDAIALTPAHLRRLMEVIDLLRTLIVNVRECGDEFDTDVNPLVATLRDEAAHPPRAEEEQQTAALGGAPSSDPAATTASAPAPSGEEPRSMSVKDLMGGGPPLQHGDPAAGTVRVSVALLDRLMNLMGELILSRNRIIQLVKMHSAGDTDSQEACQRLRQVTSAIRQAGDNQVDIIKSKAEREASIEFAKAQAVRPRLVGKALREIGQDREVIETLFAVLETQEIVAGGGEIILMPTGAGILPALEAERDVARTPPPMGR